MHQPKRNCLLNLGVYVKRPGTLQDRVLNDDDRPMLRGFLQRYTQARYWESLSTGTKNASSNIPASPVDPERPTD
jgi:hypothetical protein